MVTKDKIYVSTHGYSQHLQMYFVPDEGRESEDECDTEKKNKEKNHSVT
jgi:hypothetical protein